VREREREERKERERDVGREIEEIGRDVECIQDQW
jgi:hypothetical protein